jgi:hypothetical protein
MNVQQCGCPSSTSQAQVVVALSTQGWMLHVLADLLLVDVTWLRHGQGHDMAGAGQASSAALSAESIAHQAAAPECRRAFQRSASCRIIQRKPASGQELLTRGASMRFHALPLVACWQSSMRVQNFQASQWSCHHALTGWSEDSVVHAVTCRASHVPIVLPRRSQ